MESITLKILASDILTTNYTDSQDCAITRALARAGRPDLQDDANQIIKKLNVSESDEFGDIEREIVIYSNNIGYQKMEESVYGMYNAKRGQQYCGKLHPIVDMEFTITF
jgi:hypothetical protein